MTRPLPPIIAALIKPVPGDFAPSFTDHGKFVRWADTLTVPDHGPIEVELGYSKAGGKADESKEAANLRARVWQTMELARLGRADLLGYCLVSRHKGRAGKKA
jgi:hypothetical protein